MIPLSRLKPRHVETLVLLQGGASVVVRFRPYTMADHAWFQENFLDDDEQKKLALLQVEPIAKIAWHMMDNESKKLFSEQITYKEYNEATGQEDVLAVHGHKKLLHAINGEESFWALLDAFTQCKGHDGFVSEENEDIGVKKKTTPKMKHKLIGARSLKDLLLNMVTRPRKSLN